jgi:hypothetical protein
MSYVFWFLATVTEKLGRHKLLLKKRKSQSGRSSGELLNSDESSSSRESLEKQSGETLAGSDAALAGDIERQPIGIRPSSPSVNAASLPATNERNGSGAGVKRLERLPTTGRSAIAAPSRGGMNRFSELLKNRREEQQEEEEQEQKAKGKKTDVASLYETPRRPAQGMYK